ncbi:MAG: hypothetical protein D6797_05460, partial [Bdellovibrio sp.]
AKKEKEKLRLQALENEKKEFALNKYQQLIRNIINTNLLSKAKIRKKQKQIAALKAKTAKELKKLRVQRAKVEARLEKTKSDLSLAQRALSIEERKKEELISQLKSLKQQYKEQKEKLKEELENRQKELRAQYEQKLKRQKLSALQKAKALKKYREQMRKVEEQYKKKVGSLSKKISESERELKRAQFNLNARKRLAQRIKKNFQKAGIKAKVDPKTGDVILTFGDEYFDMGKANLKPKMKKILEKSIPIYAKSLFEDKEVAKKLSYVEIVGFASPTYKGKFVDPQSIKPEHQEAVKYNLDLSYKRARSIFEYIFDTKKMKFGWQKKLRKMVKVSGQGFLSEDPKERAMAEEMSAKEYCKKFDCKKAQRVIIKFDLEDK